jgi:hypothetical protein
MTCMKGDTMRTRDLFWGDFTKIAACQQPSGMGMSINDIQSNLKLGWLLPGLVNLLQHIHRSSQHELRQSPIYWIV